MELSVSPEELISELQQQIGQLNITLAAQSIIIRKLQEGDSAKDEEEDDDKYDEHGVAVGEGERL